MFFFKNLDFDNINIRLEKSVGLVVMAASNELSGRRFEPRRHLEKWDILQPKNSKICDIYRTRPAW